jgi:hypothetical protein
MYKYNDAFRANKPLIEHQTYKNCHTTLHDNLNDTLQSEVIVEYRINIDSSDRDPAYYPNPFQYSVNFGPVSGGSINQHVWIDENKKNLGKMIVKQFVPGLPKPCINQAFKNVKYIRIDNIILPRFRTLSKTGLDYNLEGPTLDNEIFLYLNIKEMPTKNTFGTNTVNEKGNILYPDTIRDNYFSCITRHIGIVFDDNMLGNISKMTFEFLDRFGNPITIISPDPVDLDPNNKESLNNAFNKNFQNHITLVFGIVENQLSTVTKYYS